MRKNNNSLYRVYVDSSGVVWFSHQDQMPVRSGLNQSHFVNQLPMSKDDTVQLVAEPSNVNIILRLYERKLTGGLGSVQVCSPASPDGYHKKRPEIAILDSARWVGWPASLGGWHEFTDADYPSYYLAAQYFSNVESGYDSDSINSMLELHPAWPSLSFIPHIARTACAKLIATILDPRWFVDLKEPEKNSKLENFLGLTPQVQLALNDNGPDGMDENITLKQLKNCELVMSVWRVARPVSKSDYLCPSNFLWRLHATEGADAMADLRTSQTFISFLKHIWLDAVYRKRGGVSEDGLFVPEYFFKHEDEISAFKKHTKAFTKK